MRNGGNEERLAFLPQRTDRARALALPRAVCYIIACLGFAPLLLSSFAHPRMQSPLPDPAPPTTCSASPAPATTAARAPSERREGTDENVQRTRTHQSDGTTVVGGHVEPTALIGSSIVLERTHTQNGCPRLEFTFKPKVSSAPRLRVSEAWAESQKLDTCGAMASGPSKGCSAGSHWARRRVALTERMLSQWPLLYFCFLLFWNLVVPCLLYYLLKICELPRPLNASALADFHHRRTKAEGPHTHWHRKRCPWILFLL